MSGALSNFASPQLGGTRYATLPIVPTIHETTDPTVLRPNERKLFDGIEGTPARKREWLAGRIVARAALTALGHPDVEVLRHESGAPRLSGDDAGSLHIAITHGRRLAAAIAARADGPWPHVGIDVVDAEDLARVRSVAKRVLTEDERRRSDESPLHTRLAWGAREAVAKATSTGMFVFALSKVWTTAVDEVEKRVLTNLAGVTVIYEVLDDGGVLVLAGATAAAFAAAQAAASRPT